MAEGGWEHASEWAAKAQGMAPAIVGGSQKHGGADLGPTSAKAAWRQLGVDGMGTPTHPRRQAFGDFRA
jgi:DNA (cytosine-5)-methyltransferase 1